jgi:CubicO group peptidase (beta-lactamase class C family)
MRPGRASTSGTDACHDGWMRDLPLASPPRVRRRDVLKAGAVGAGAVLLPTRSSAAVPTGLHRDVRELMAAGKLPGLSAAVVRGTEVVWTHAWGLADVGRRRPVEPDTLFMLASVSKTVVATAALQAVEDGLLWLDADVNDVLPFRVRNPVHEDEPLTLRQLMTHTSSIRDDWNLLIASYVDGDASMPLGRFLRRYLAPNGADFSQNNYYSVGPGRAYRYANVGVALAAYLVEAASGIFFDAWCERRIFEPLGMTRTSWHLAGLPVHDVAIPYSWSGKGNGYVASAHYGYPDYPDGALRTTAPQLARHLAMVMGGGAWRGRRLLSAATVRELRRDQVPDLEPGQGLIWFRLPRGGRSLLGHDGGDTGVATVCFFDPAEEVGVVALANGNWRTVSGDYALYLIMDRLFEAAPTLG